MRYQVILLYSSELGAIPSYGLQFLRTLTVLPDTSSKDPPYCINNLIINLFDSRAILYCIAFISCIVFWPIAVLFIKYYHDCKYYRARGHEKAKREKSHEDIGAFHLNLFLNNEFIRCFHQFVSLIFSMNFSQFEQLKKKTNFLLVQNSYFSRFASAQLKKKS